MPVKSLSGRVCRVLSVFALVLIAGRANEAKSDDPIAAGFTGAKVGQVRDDNGLKLKLIWCPPGRFTMGTPADQPRLRTTGERQAEVTLTAGFWLGRTELTQAQWKSVMGSLPWEAKDVKVKEGDDYPATNVSWVEATAFCEKLTEQEKLAGRLPENSRYILPTEAEWEYACRAGTTTLFSFGDDESKIADYGWTRKYGRRGRSSPREQFAHPVAQKRPNPWGFFDMHGNAAEWCRDLYFEILPGGSDPEMLKAPPDLRLQALKEKFPNAEIEQSPGGALRVYRGGYYDAPPIACRSAYRGPRSNVEPRSSYTGFRVALEATRGLNVPR